MLLNGGILDGERILGRKTVAYMTSEHLEPIPRTDDDPGPAYGFGLGFAVRTRAGTHDQPGSIGDFYWAGYASTFFWVDPQERLIAIFMIQAPGVDYDFAALMRTIVYAAILR